MAQVAYRKGERRSRIRKNRFTDGQIIGILKEGEAEANVAELCRRHETSKEGYSRRKAKHGGLEVNEAWRVDYHTQRPHSSLGHQTPEQLVAAHAAALRSLPPATEAHLSTQEADTGNKPPVVTL